MEEITRPSPAQHSPSEGVRRPRRHPLRTTLILGMVLIPTVCALTFVAAAYASTATIRLPPVDRQTLGRIASSFIPTAPSPVPPPSLTPLPTFQPPATIAVQFPQPTTGFASRTPFPSLTPSPSPTATETSSPTMTPTFTITPTFTATPTATASPTPSTTPTPSPTASRTPTSTTVPPTSTPVPPTSTSAPATATGTTPPSPTSTTQPPSSTPNPGCAPSTNAGYEATLLGLINDERADQGLPAYSSNAQLQAAARDHSTDMACNAYFSHTGSDGSSVGDRVSAQGYSWSWVGENIYAGSSATPQSAFNWWMNSAPHRANLLNSNYVDIGIGYIYEPDSPYSGYFTAVFARP